TAVIANQPKVRPPRAAIDFCPLSAATALMTAKNTSGTAIIRIRLTYSVPSGSSQVSAAGPISQPASAPNTNPPSTRRQNGIRNPHDRAFMRRHPREQSATILDAIGVDDPVTGTPAS